MFNSFLRKIKPQSHRFSIQKQHSFPVCFFLLQNSEQFKCHYLNPCQFFIPPQTDCPCLFSWWYPSYSMTSGFHERFPSSSFSSDPPQIKKRRKKNKFSIPWPIFLEIFQSFNIFPSILFLSSTQHRREIHIHKKMKNFFHFHSHFNLLTHQLPFNSNTNFFMPVMSIGFGGREVVWEIKLLMQTKDIPCWEPPSHSLPISIFSSSFF